MKRFSLRMDSEPFQLAAGALLFAGRVAGAAEAADEGRRLADQFEGLLVLAASDERDVAVGLMPAGQSQVQGEVPARSITAFFGTACGKAM